MSKSYLSIENVGVTFQGRGAVSEVLRDVELQLENLAEPGEVAIELVGAFCILLEPPVSSNSVLCRAVHLTRANLDFKELLVRAEDRRVK